MAWIVEVEITQTGISRIRGSVAGERDCGAICPVLHDLRACRDAGDSLDHRLGQLARAAAGDGPADDLDIGRQQPPSRLRAADPDSRPDHRLVLPRAGLSGRPKPVLENVRVGAGNDFSVL